MSPALTVEEALGRILANATPTGETEAVGLETADGRVLVEPLRALLTQPPFTASAMDGYAVRGHDVTSLPSQLRVVGEAAAGHAFNGTVGPGEAARIFTGAPLPQGADAIVIQENTVREGPYVTVREGQPDAEHIRPLGGDFRAGEALIASNQRLSARDLTLAAAMGHARLVVRRRPVVAILATGDELVAPGVPPGPDQIVCSNTFCIAAMVRAAGGEPRLLGIARDTAASLGQHLDRAAGADVLVTVGGASVGDHDLVGPELKRRGMALSFWKIAMRPGKPLMYGRLGEQHVLGLPGNPVSSIVCTQLFLVPLIKALCGLERRSDAMSYATTVTDLEPNGPRAHYMRATLSRGEDGRLEATALPNQDSSLMLPLATADCLLVRPIKAPAVAAGGRVPILTIDF